MLRAITSFLIGCELLGFVWWFLRRPRTPREALGGVLISGALLLLLLARRELGRSFSVRAKATRLVTTGVYARLRHPIYLAGGVLVAGLALLLGSWWVLVILGVLIPLQRLRARREETVLRARFGEEYDRYRRRTWF